MRRAALLAELVRTGLGGVAYLLLAHALPLATMGTVSAVSALVAMAAPLLLAGVPLRLTRSVATGTDGGGSRSLAVSALVYAGAASALLGAGLVAGGVLRSGGGQDVALLVLAESLVTLGAILVHSFAAAARRPGLLLGAACIGGLPRLVGTVAVLVTTDRAVATYAVTVLVSGVVLLAAGLSRLGTAPVRLLRPRDVVGPSPDLGYVGSSLLSRVNDDLDKVLLARLLAPEAVALYAVPYRLAFYAMIPGRAILTARLGGWYRDGGSVVDRRFVLPLLVALATSAAAVTVTWVTWEWLTTWLLRPEYAAGQALIPLFGAAVVLRVAHYFVGEMLLAQGRSGTRLRAQVTGTVVGVVALVALVPAWGLVGAAAATALGDGVIAALALAALCRRRAVPSPCRAGATGTPNPPTDLAPPRRRTIEERTSS